MGSASSKKASTIEIQPLQTLSLTDKDESLTDLEETRSMSEKSISLTKEETEATKTTTYKDESLTDSEETRSLSEKSLSLTKEETEAKKTNTFKSLETNLKILFDINGHLDMFGFFDEVFIQATVDLSTNTIAFQKASLETLKKLKQEYGDLFVKLGGVKIVCDVVLYCHNRGYFNENNGLIPKVFMPLLYCMEVMLDFTDAHPRHSHLVVEHGGYLPCVVAALKTQKLSLCSQEMQVCYDMCYIHVSIYYE